MGRVFEGGVIYTEIKVIQYTQMRMERNLSKITQYRPRNVPDQATPSVVFHADICSSWHAGRRS